jgi:hypothetical protein
MRPAAAVVAATTAASPDDPSMEAPIDRVLAHTPLVDAHNRLPRQIRSRFGLGLARNPGARPQRRTRSWAPG